MRRNFFKRSTVMVNLNEKKLLSKEAKDLLGNLKPYKNKKLCNKEFCIVIVRKAIDTCS